MVCDKAVCERWCVAKNCVTELCVTKMCVCERDKVVCAISARPATQIEGGCRQVPRLPGKTKLDVAKCHAYHAKRKWMSPSATRATQKCRGATGDQRCPKAPPDPAKGHQCPRHQTQPSVTSATPATQNEDRCRQVPRLPRKTQVDVAKRHACHANEGV